MTRDTDTKPPRDERPRILVVDDEENVVQILEDLLSESPYEVDAVNTGEAALKDIGQMTNYDEQIRSVERVTVTKVTLVKGRGVPESPVREIERFYDDDGRCLGFIDPCIGAE